MAMIAAPPITRTVDAGNRHHADIFTVGGVWRRSKETGDDGGETVRKHGTVQARVADQVTFDNVCRHHRWPTCSAITTSAAGRMVKIANHSKRGV